MNHSQRTLHLHQRHLQKVDMQQKLLPPTPKSPSVCVRPLTFSLATHPCKHHAALGDGAHRDFGAVQLQQELEEGGVGAGGHDGAKEFHIWIHKEKLTQQSRLLHTCPPSPSYIYTTPPLTHTHTAKSNNVVCSTCDPSANKSIRIELAYRVAMETTWEYTKLATLLTANAAQGLEV